MGWQSFGILAIMFAAMYFLTIRPQKKKMEEDRKMRSKMAVGDQIVTIGGIRGRVTRISEESFEIETGSENHRIEFLKQGLSYIVTPAKGFENVNVEDKDSAIEFVDEDEQEQ